MLEYVGDTEAHELSDPLKGVALGALVGGVVVYSWPTWSSSGWLPRELNVVRLGAAVVLLACWAPIAGVPALGQLGVVTAVVVLALLIETVVFAERRREIRDSHAHGA